MGGGPEKSSEIFCESKYCRSNEYPGFSSDAAQATHQLACARFSEEVTLLYVVAWKVVKPLPGSVLVYRFIIYARIREPENHIYNHI